jgi:hypothetical protein
MLSTTSCLVSTTSCLVSSASCFTPSTLCFVSTTSCYTASIFCYTAFTRCMVSFTRCLLSTTRRLFQPHAACCHPHAGLFQSRTGCCQPHATCYHPHAGCCQPTIDANAYWVKNGKASGEIIVKIKAQLRTMYNWQYCLDPMATNAWIDMMSTHSRLHIENLTAGQKYWVRVCFIDKNGTHAFTNPISIIVI